METKRELLEPILGLSLINKTARTVDLKQTDVGLRLSGNGEGFQMWSELNSVRKQWLRVVRSDGNRIRRPV